MSYQPNDGGDELMNFIAAGLSDVGRERDHNEDSFCILPEYRLFVVADGMGGHSAGDVASKMATHTVASFFEATAQEDATWPFSFDPQLSVDENRLLTAIKLANKRIFDASVSNAEVQGMGTTVVGVLFAADSDKVYIAHVGDSRCYRIRAGELVQMTKDHSLVNDYLSVMPDMTDEQRAEIPTNVITRALGMQDSVVVDLSVDDPQPGDVYLLCSDGLSGMITDDMIRDAVVAAGDDVEGLSSTLISLANEHGGEDNITAVLLRVTD